MTTFEQVVLGYLAAATLMRLFVDRLLGRILKTMEKTIKLQGRSADLIAKAVAAELAEQRKGQAKA